MAGSISRVVTDFLTTTPGELSVSRGDVVLVESRPDRLWCECRLLPNGALGLVPSGHLIELERPPLGPDQVLFVAVSDFPGQQSDDLIMRKGEFVIGTHKIDDNWWHGTCGRNSGMFPVSYVMELDSGTALVRYARVKQSMSAQLDEEIDLFEGDTVTILEKVDKNFYRGTSRGRTGIFPCGFVVIIEDQASSPEKPPLEPEPAGSFAASAIQKSHELKMAQAPNNHESNNANYFLDQPPPSYATVMSNSFEAQNTQPHGITLYAFSAQYPNELSFGEGETVQLLEHVDQDWIKGELNGRQGIFPSSFVNIIVDCGWRQQKPPVPPPPQPAVPTTSGLKAGVFARVVYEFQAQMSGDATVSLGETVFIASLGDDGQWATIKKQNGESGLCPANCLDVLDFTSIGKTQSRASNIEDLISKNISQIQSIPAPQQTRHTVSVFATRPSPPSSPPPPPPEEPPEVPVVDRPPPAEPVRKPSLPPKLPSHVANSVRAPSPPSLSRGESLRVPHRVPPPVPQLPNNVSLIADGSASDSSMSADAISDPGDMALASKEKRQEQRQNVIAELAITEKDFARDLKVTYETFNLHNPAQLEARGVDAVMLFGNILEIIKCSETLLDKILTAMKGKPDEEQLIAPCFLEMAEEIKVTYTNYCINNDNSLALLSKYADNEDVQNLFRKGLETLQYQIACFDMSSIIIKPVQRIMKYPLILNELYKSTEESHPDKASLLEAVKIMADVASHINEAKRTQDLVSKYLEDDSTLSSKMSRLSLHSMAKKLNRSGAKITSTLGKGRVVKDEQFDEQERAFNNLEKGLRNCLRGLESVLGQLNEVSMSQLQSSEAIYAFYDEKASNNDDFRIAQFYVANELLTQFRSSLQKYVLNPMTTVLELSSGPSKLIQKRNDKLLDYEALMSKAEKNKDPRLQDELNFAKNTYEALNTQLLKELPTFTSVAEDFFVDCISSYIRARKIFSAKAAKQYLSLMELPYMSGYSADQAAEVFKVKHNLVCNELAQLTFCSKNLKSESGTLRRQSKAPPSPLPARQEASTSQGESQKAYLQSKFPFNKLYKVVDSYVTKELLEVSVSEGDIVAVIKQQDPMGNVDVWFVDSGDKQGFLPSKCLQPLFDQSTPEVQKPARKVSSEDLHPPTYEEVLDPKYSEVEDIYEEIPDFEFVYAEYDFSATNENTLGVHKGQVLKVLQKHDLQGNDEWWLVEDRDGHEGYVPANYLKKYN